MAEQITSLLEDYYHFDTDEGPKDYIVSDIVEYVDNDDEMSSWDLENLSQEQINMITRLYDFALYMYIAQDMKESD